MGKEDLFATEELGGRVLHRVYALTVAAGICMILWYRISIPPPEGARWMAAGMLCAELWFSLYWAITQFARWRPIRRRAFRDRLSQRYGGRLPGVDVFVCTADPATEPPSLVVSTVLSAMAYDYPREKLSVYLSDDAGSELTFYALWEASRFAKRWLPFCARYKLEPRSPGACFSAEHERNDTCDEAEWSRMKTLYSEMANRIDSTTSSGEVPEEVKGAHKGFAEWRTGMTSKDHPAIVEVLIDAKDQSAVDDEGNVLPTLVYMAREKKPQHNHNFKAGALNSLLRVSSVISNNPIILTLDCDMYPNDSQSVRDALCFFLDEKMGGNIAFVQYPQSYNNMTRNDIYANALSVPYKIEFCGIDSFGGPLYIGTGCFHRRETLCGRKFTVDYKEDWSRGFEQRAGLSAQNMEDQARPLITSTFEQGTKWGIEMGLVYGSAIEDVTTGLQIQCRGWRSVYLDPPRKAFLGVGPTTLSQTVLQHKRWSEGHLKICLSRFNPFLLGHGKLTLGHRMGYLMYGSWALNALPTLYYVVIPSLCMLKGIQLFPRMSSPWLLSFAYVPLAKYSYSIIESIRSGDTLKGWWNSQRMWMYKRVTSYLFATVDTILNILGLSKMGFVITAKVSRDDESQRYKKEILEFGPSTANMIIASIALLNAICGAAGAKRLMSEGAADKFFLQMVICGLITIVNAPLYEAMFLRKDNGRIPTSATIISIGIAMLACQIPVV